MLRLSELKYREVINVADGRRLGLIKDIDLDLERGKINGLIIPVATRSWNFWARNDDVFIPWSAIKKIGIDVILVDLPNFVEIPSR
ncbi:MULTISPECIES: YlmC/YmxH family sporulation protein [Carboxydothermus]|uniref:PRC-barrel domain protein n=2 Tax=Carboxydothermus TaxID=129957 RepID=Q3AAG2_CARHZ|nr:MULTISPECIES: YlmC/YmxH family sporulation protein [Carboxydothermus]ABB15500.1 PRC-barrel domain protein [Carboxydothermus hydrogenoformans Z-2901]NYE58766.1 YlmC/YmxH family sporulation protein [Carboxydothermus ferrireducens DSM 11255]